MATQHEHERYGFRSGPRPGEERLEPVESGLGRLLHAAEALPADAVSLLVADELVAHDRAGLAEMDALASLRLRQSLVARWEYGWQPADLIHVVRRSRSRLVPLLATAIVAQVGSGATAMSPPQVWRDQLMAVADEAVAPGAEHTPDRLVAAFAGPCRPVVEIWTDLVQLLVMLAALPALEQLLPPPSAWARSTVHSRPVENGSERSRVLNRVRTLLAKAEATEFAAEAETFTAKAQDLMTRHAIDEALLRVAGDGPIDIRGIRVHIRNPYAGEKVSLLNQVARANRCRAVWNKPLGLVTVLGTPVDVDQVEMLFTSLLIQATRAMAEAGARRAGSFDRSASFRRSFLMAYAVRIGERLTESSAAAAASYGAELVPVLQRQTDAVQAEFERLFPQTRTAKAGRYNAAGWGAGREAADRAHLTAGRLTA
ncbi:MAG TPA: DUF2786 domain-containing protein [Propionibacteriaceae bacterium]|nr:DUF2786 domain-containing protein [Propionibacteriaceae bacterium]